MQKSEDKYDFSVRWEPFLLRPNIPVEGVPKAPETPGNPRVGAHLKEAGSAVGIDFTGKCNVYPNTLQAHAFLDYAKVNHPQKQNNLAEAIFKAYFTDGNAPIDDTLLTIAGDLGFNKDEVNAVIKDQQKIQQAAEAARSWSIKGVTGVPYFLVNGQKAFSGAQDPETFLRVFDIIAEKFPLAGIEDTQKAA